MTALVVVLGFLKTHWKAVALSSSTLIAGVWLGRHSVTCPVPPPCPTCPTVQCAAAIQAPSCRETVRTVVHWRTQPSTVAGCPPQLLPDVGVVGAGVASAGNISTQAEAAPPKVEEVPKAAPVASQGPSLPHWTVMGGAGVSLEGKLSVVGELEYHPFAWPVGLGLLLDVRPATISESSVCGMVNVRF